MNLGEQMQSVRTRVKIAKENLETTEKRLKDVQLFKNEYEQRKREAMKKKMRTEFDLRAEQCKALELDLIVLDAVEVDLALRSLSIPQRALEALCFLLESGCQHHQSDG